MTSPFPALRRGADRNCRSRRARCGSSTTIPSTASSTSAVFTHIDDLADAWLLELQRILEPGGMLYVTIHDERTVELIENSSAQWLEWLRTRDVYRRSKDSFDIMSLNRAGDPQVFYAREYFLKMLSATFDVLNVAPEAYFYQTAILARRRVRDSAPPPAR